MKFNSALGLKDRYIVHTPIQTKLQDSHERIENWMSNVMREESPRVVFAFHKRVNCIAVLG